MRKESDDNGLIGSLFSGYGGLDLGVGMALGGGMRVAYTSDIEPGPCAIERYHAHGDDCPNLGDITKIDFERLPDTDVVVGGSPCFPAGSLVLTDRGFIPIEQVRVGDLALTHLGNWKRVIDTGCHIGDTSPERAGNARHRMHAQPSVPGRTSLPGAMGQRETRLSDHVR